MDLNGYIDRIEASIDSPDALVGLRDEVAKDGALSDADREFLDERVGTYLADHGRSAGPGAAIDTEDAPGAGPT